ncbi:lipid IV(A) 3-deoxy-D-manno-octulosonic acid transferase [Nevskia sp.]|uniref:lipid IV(A) 3-deoxy-D-manno-octulosonic acid transferase n=1 Tax=Nevskia sp. TaxID=1929292 RepID=UPI0025E47141|nr:lipid IV(A) 3-deoxy-D-manno-octulosonic acid transferase [Nevskia sp.]
MRHFYTLLLYLAAPFALLRLLWKSRQLAGYRGRIGERFGFVPRTSGDAIAVWVHAVSVGEALAAQPLIEALLARYGERSIWVTTTTPTGSARVIAAFGDRVHHSYAPYDLPDVVSRFLDRVRPARFVVMETELWPNLFRACCVRGIPLTIANARLSPRSFRGYGRVRGFARDTLSDVTMIAAQSKSDAARFRTLGGVRERVRVIGNLKFDLNLPEASLDDGSLLRARFGARPVWIAASTHDGEEAAALDAHAALVELQPDALLVLVPRHPQRFDAVWSLIEDTGLRSERRTRLAALDKSGHAPDLSAAQVFLGDSMGEMFLYLAMADVAFVGGSLVDVGGHNVLEPAALGLPVLFGPQMHNFEAARALLLEKIAAVEVADAAQLAEELAVLLASPDRCRAMGAAGAAAVAGNRGALKRLLTIIEAQTPCE